jgi:putative tricarboxylic transport membrane protein
MAVFLGLLVLHGLQPGPLMLIDHQVEIYGLIWALTASCVLASFIGLLFVRPLAKLTLLDSNILVPVVITAALVGSYAIDRTIENSVLTVVFGIIGYLMIRFDYPRLTIVVALILGSTAERNFSQSMMMSNGSMSIYLTRTVCVSLLAILAAVLLYSIWGGSAKRDSKTPAREKAACS